MSVSVDIALDFVLNGLAKLLEASERIKAARAEGRGLTLMEWHEIVQGNDQARSDAQAAVELAKSEGR